MKPIDGMHIRLGVLVAAFVLVLSAASGHGQSTPPEPRVSIQATLDYHYGDWDQGRMDLDPRIGMVAPDVEIWFPRGKLGLGFRYVSGDFDGAERFALPDGSIPSGSDTFGSRKEMTLDESREDVRLMVLYRPKPWFVLQAGYEYLEFEQGAMLDLVSTVGTYGSGRESYRSQARGPALGAKLNLPVRGPWSLVLSGVAMPWLRTEVRGSYEYALMLEDRMLAEQWARNGDARGFSGEGALQFDVPGEHIALRLGYVYQRIESEDEIQPTWVDLSLGQESRDWREDRYHGATFGAVFRF